MLYYVRQSGKIDGPFGVGYIQDLVAAGKLTPVAEILEAGDGRVDLRGATAWVSIATLFGGSVGPGRQSAQLQTTESSPATSQYRYRVIPFVGTIQTGFFGIGSAQTVSQQLQNVIDMQAAEGWDFYSLEKVNIEVQPGCIGGLLGQSASYITSDQIIFRQANAEP